MMWPAQGLTQGFYPQAASTIRELAGGGMIISPAPAGDCGKSARAAGIRTRLQPSVATSDGRVRFMELAWDVVRSGFANRGLRYEMFCAAVSFVTRGHPGGSVTGTARLA